MTHSPHSSVDWAELIEDVYNKADSDGNTRHTIEHMASVVLRSFTNTSPEGFRHWLASLVVNGTQGDQKDLVAFEQELLELLQVVCRRCNVELDEKDEKMLVNNFTTTFLGTCCQLARGGNPVEYEALMTEQWSTLFLAIAREYWVNSWLFAH